MALIPITSATQGQLISDAQEVKSLDARFYLIGYFSNYVDSAPLMCISSETLSQYLEQRLVRTAQAPRRSSEMSVTVPEAVSEDVEVVNIETLFDSLHGKTKEVYLVFRNEDTILNLVEGVNSDYALEGVSGEAVTLYGIAHWKFTLPFQQGNVLLPSVQVFPSYEEEGEISKYIPSGVAKEDSFILFIPKSFKGKVVVSYREWLIPNE